MASKICQAQSDGSACPLEAGGSSSSELAECRVLKAAQEEHSDLGRYMDCQSANGGKGMFLATKAAWAGIVFILLTTGISGPRPTPLNSAANLNKEVPEVEHRNDVKTMQQALRDKGHYRGEVDGVFGLRTGASIRGFQKAENLPVTGQLNTETAGKLGISPEGREATRNETTKGKPSAYIEWIKGSRKISVTLRKAVKPDSAPENRRGPGEDSWR